jgi:phenylpropionate dioxygenase-like ring-hydroxylating dioxygenase large terminal subunit
MFPLKTDLPAYPRNAWYVAAWRGEVGRETLLARTILGEPVVMYRKQDGCVVALDDRCAHRKYPLSKGMLIGDDLRCGYHGFRYDASGACRSIPSQAKVPAHYCVRRYAVHESWEWIWIWMGEPDQADTTKIPSLDNARVGDPGAVAVIGGRVVTPARHFFVHDNLLDLSHVSYLHHDTIGGEGVAAAPAQIKQLPGHLEVVRHVKNDIVEHLPMAKAIGMTGPVDRTLPQWFYPPSLHITGSDFSSAAEGGHSPGKAYGSIRVLHGITPQTPTTTHYFWAFTRNFGLQDSALSQRMKAYITATIAQDEDGTAACEAMMQSERMAPEVHAVGDAAGIKGRRIMEKLIEAEAR